jgi:hypothetical protein
MAKAVKRSRRARTKSTARVLTLTQLAKAAGISIPTAQIYKRKYQDRLPKIGSGRQQRYPVAAIAVFRKIRAENEKNRGQHTGAAGSGLLSLAEINRRTKISYPTLLRYVRLHGRELPSEGSGRDRRYRPLAVEVFQRLRRESRRGRPRLSDGRSALGHNRDLADRIRKIESMQAQLTRQLNDVVTLLRKPLQVTIRPM